MFDPKQIFTSLFRNNRNVASLRKLKSGEPFITKHKILYYKITWKKLWSLEEKTSTKCAWVVKSVKCKFKVVSFWLEVEVFCENSGKKIHTSILLSLGQYAIKVNLLIPTFRGDDLVGVWSGVLSLVTVVSNVSVLDMDFFRFSVGVLHF